MEVGNNPDGGRIHWLCTPKRLQCGCPGIPAGPSNLGGRSANDTAQGKVQDHRTLRRCQPLLLQIAGEHLYHGYWIRGEESKEQAQRQLIEHLARLAKIPQGAAVLDVGCGFGASSLYLCKQFDATTYGCGKGTRTRGSA